MGVATASEIIEAVVGETRYVAISWDDVLLAGDTITGSPTAVEVTTSNLTIASVAANTVAKTILRESVAIGRALLFKVSGHLAANSPYTIKMTVSTTDGDGPIIRYVTLKVVSS
jgi:hypothetical protein